MPTIINIQDYQGGIKKGTSYMHSKWGNEDNFNFYYDAIVHSSLSETSIPRFYLMVEEEEIIGCYGLISNDLISRHDLYPWLACLFIEENHRGQSLGKLLLEHGAQEAKRCGFSSLYLTTDHKNYYEKYGWTRIEDGYNLFGEQGRIYEKKLD